MAPRFSVLLPTHNRADVVGYAIQSVLWQTEQDFEILIVGDGCTDNTAEVVGSFADPRVRWFDLPKAPHYGYANRNIALKQAKGEFIAFMAHDDIMLHDHLTLLAATLQDTGAEWAYSRPLRVDIEGQVAVRPMNLDNPSELEVFLTCQNTIPATCVVHRRECFQKYGYWPEDVPSAADWHFWIRIIEGGARTNFAVCREPTCLHFVADWRRDTSPIFRENGWPIVRSHTIPPGHTEQQIFFDAISARRDEWVSTLRAQAHRAVDEIAWRAMTKLLPQIAQLTAKEEELCRSIATAEEEKARALQALATTKEEKKYLLKELEAVYESASWRATAPLRAIKRFFRRP